MKWKGTKTKISKDEDFQMACYDNESGEYVANFHVSPVTTIDESEANLDLFIDAVQTVQQCDKLPSELLSERDESVRIIREAIYLYENRGVDIPELWIDNAFLFIKQIEHGN